MRSVNEGRILDYFKGLSKSGNGKSYYMGGSIARKAKALTMVFPMICDNSLKIDSINLINKANERNCVSLLQMILSSQVLTGKDGEEVLGKIHKNLKMSYDIYDIIDAMDRVAAMEGYTELTVEDRDFLNECVKEIMAIDANKYPINSLSENSLANYRIVNKYGKNFISYIKEADPNYYTTPPDQMDDYYKYAKNRREEDKEEREKEKHRWAQEDREKDKQDKANKREYDRNRDERERNKEEREKEKHGWAQKDREKAIKDDEYKKTMEIENIKREIDTRRIVDQDVRKANEIQPSLIRVGFYYITDKTTTDPNVNNIIATFDAGVKSFCIADDAIDIIERCVSKNKEKFSFKNLLRSLSGERNLANLIFAGDEKKKMAKSAAKRGGASLMWNVLEKRTNKNNYRKLAKDSNDASNITGLVINSLTAEYMKKNHKFDIMDRKNARLIMESFNLLSLWIVDETEESASYIYDDGDYMFQTVPFSALDKEAKQNNGLVKSINLLASKM